MIESEEERTAARRTLAERMRSSSRHVVRFGAALAPTVGALAVQLVTFAITARGLGAASFGTYNVILALAAFGTEIVGLGSADVLVRAVAREGTAFRTHFGHMLASIVATLPLVTIGGLVYLVATDPLPIPIWAMALGLCAEVLVSRMSSSTELVMVAHGHTVLAGWFRLSGAALRAAAAALYFLALGSGELVGWIVAVSLQAALTSGLFLSFLIWRYGGPIGTFLVGQTRTGLPFCVNQGARAAQSNIDRVVLAHFADAASLGVYSAASRMMQVGLFPIQVATRMTYPRFFREGANGLAASRAYAVRLLPIYLLVGILAGGAVVAAARVLPLVLGVGYGETFEIGSYLALSLPAMALQYPAADALTGAGHQSLRAVIQIAAALAFGGLMAVGANLWGAFGLVAAFVSAHVTLAIVLWATTFLLSNREAPVA